VDYATKLIVLLSVATAILLEAFLSARAWPNQLPLTIAAFFVTASSSLALAELSAAIVLFFVFLMPALLLLVHGDYSVYYGTIWLAALLGAIVPASVRRGWRFPARWKAPLVLWALTIALTWPIVAMRESDFNPRLLLNAYHLNRWDIEALRPIAIAWICDVASTLGMGLLWFDWLCCVFGDDEPRFRRRLLPVLAASWSITTLVGLYQFFGDMLFLNFGLFGALKRASGTMRDANPFGIVAALGGPWLIAAASLTRSRLFHALTIGGLVASWVALWAAGGRRALGGHCVRVRGVWGLGCAREESLLAPDPARTGRRWSPGDCVSGGCAVFRTRRARTDRAHAQHAGGFVGPRFSADPVSP
jgi:hypothetical protein